MKIKTSELTGAALDWAVAKAWQPVYKDASLVDAVRKGYNPSTDWSMAGPIIERANMCVNRDNSCLEWEAYLVQEDKKYGGIERVEAYGLTPMIAAMRCFVASRLGDAIDVPDDLLNTN